MADPIDPTKRTSHYPQAAYSDTDSLMKKLRLRASSPKRFDSSVIGLSNPTLQKITRAVSRYFDPKKPT